MYQQDKTQGVTQTTNLHRWSADHFVFCLFALVHSFFLIKMILLVLAIVLILYFFPDYTKHILLLSSLVVILAFRNKASLNARYIPWIDRYDALVEWMNAHGGAWPRDRGHLGRMSSMSEADAEEHRLAKWMQEQRGERSRMQEIESTSEGDISRGELFERLLRPQPAPLSRPIDLSVEPLSYSPEPQRPEPLFFPPEPQPLGAIDLSVDAILEEDRMKRRRIEEQRGR